MPVVPSDQVRIALKNTIRRKSEHRHGIKIVRPEPSWTGISRHSHAAEVKGRGRFKHAQPEVILVHQREPVLGRIYPWCMSPQVRQRTEAECAIGPRQSVLIDNQLAILQVAIDCREILEIVGMQVCTEVCNFHVQVESKGMISDSCEGHFRVGILKNRLGWSSSEGFRAKVKSLCFDINRVSRHGLGQDRAAVVVNITTLRWLPWGAITIKLR